MYNGINVKLMGNFYTFYIIGIFNIIDYSFQLESVEYYHSVAIALLARY